MDWSAEDLARAFHGHYERLAPEFGYETRRESAVPWEEVPEQNRRLMVAVAGCVKAELDGAGDESLAPVVRDVFLYWQQRTGHERAKLDAKRARKIHARLKDGYSPDDIRQAINGAAKYPYVTDAGRSSTGTAKQRFDDIELICRDAAHLERFGLLGVGTIERAGMRSKLVGA